MNTATSTRQASKASPPLGILQKLQSIQIGGGSGPKIKQKDLVHLLTNISTLVQNGVSLAQTLETLKTDRTLRKYFEILDSLASSVRSGEAFSTALRRFPDSFSPLLINQIQVGEKSGGLNDSLGRIAKQIEHGAQLKSFIIKKLTYPAILICAGIGSVTFMMLCVIPTFQKMYEESGATLPAITQLLITAGDFARRDGWIVALLTGGSAIGFTCAMKNPNSRLWIDRMLIRLPLFGEWFKNMAILQFIDVLSNLMESGFTLAEALSPSAGAIRNRYVRGRIQGLNNAIRCGERFSTAMEQNGELFPPVVTQLVLVGERSGRLAEVTLQIRAHLQKEVEKYTNVMIGAIEPILTASLAVVVGGILLAVYLPMFDMIGQVNH